MRSQAPKPAALEAGPLHRHTPQPGRQATAGPRPARPKRLSRRIPHRLAHIRRGPPVQVALKQEAKDLAPLGFDELLDRTRPFPEELVRGHLPAQGFEPARRRLQGTECHLPFRFRPRLVCLPHPWTSALPVMRFHTPNLARMVLHQQLSRPPMWAQYDRSHRLRLFERRFGRSAPM